MSERRRKRTKFKWLRKLKRQFLAWFSPLKRSPKSKKRRRRRKRRSYRSQIPSLSDIKQACLLWFKPQRKRRRRKKRSFGSKLSRSWHKLTENLTRWKQQLLSHKKKRRRKRRKSKQYAVYVMSNQRKID